MLIVQINWVPLPTTAVLMNTAFAKCGLREFLRLASLIAHESYNPITLKQNNCLHVHIV